MIVKGDKIKLLELAMIRRYGTATPIVDPAVAKILVDKGLAIYFDNKNNSIEIKESSKNVEIDDDKIFPIEIIKG